jgi:coenzyme Q-binding protein COQ10
MPVFQATRHIAHSADQMFDLVADVERYPEFVPLCEGNPITFRDLEADVLATEMTVAYRIFRETFHSRVTLDRARGRILIEASDGPVRRLHTRWTFRERSAGSCHVEFYVSYELASLTLTLLIGAVLDAAFNGYVQAFEDRANQVYGGGAVATLRA